MKLLFLESFYGGSHRYVADGLIRHSRHKIDLITLPDQNWSWRMHGAAFYFYEKIKDILPSYDGLIVTDLINLSDLKVLLGRSCPPVILYFHENQLGYPEGSGESRGFQYGFTDISSALAADCVLFNSHTHRNNFLELADSTLNRMPDYQPGWIPKQIEDKSAVMYPGCSFQSEQAEPADKDFKQPLIIWNHRWSYDKNPDHFFIILEELNKKGINFRLALLGDHSGRIPDIFKKAQNLYKNRIIQFGFAESKTEYTRFLKQGSLVISTANQENFGISVIEAIRYGIYGLYKSFYSVDIGVF